MEGKRSTRADETAKDSKTLVIDTICTYVDSENKSLLTKQIDKKMMTCK